jgi:hypothetical protein
VLFLVSSAALLLWSDASGAEERAPKQKTQKARKVSGWGELGKPVKDSDFYELTWFRKTGTGREAKIRKTSAFLKVTSKSLIYEDTRVAIDQLESGTDVRIFGRPVSEQVPNRGDARGGVDHQIQNARVVLGDDLESKLPFDEEFVDPTAPDHKWVEAQVTKGTGGLWVKALGVDHRVTMERSAPVLKRAKVEPKRLKGRLYVQFFAWTTNERPDTGTKSDAEKPAFRAAMLVILDRGSLTTVYPLMWKR